MVGSRRLTDSWKLLKMLPHLPHHLAGVGVARGVELQGVRVVLHPLLRPPVVVVLLLLQLVVALHHPLDEGVVGEAMFLLPLRLPQ